MILLKEIVGGDMALTKKHQKEIKAMEVLLNGKSNETKMDGGIMIKQKTGLVLKRVKTVGEARHLIQKVKDGKLQLA